MPPERSRRRAMPPIKDIIEAADKVITHYSGGGRAVQSDIVSGFVRRHFKTSGPMARKWLHKALTEPGQTDLVWLASTDNKWVYRVTRSTDDPNRYVYAASLREGHADEAVNLYLDFRGCQVDSGDEAVRGVAWVIKRSTLDGFLQKLAARSAEIAERDAREQAARDAATEAAIGDRLSLIRGALAEAGIVINAEGARSSMRAMTRSVARGDGITRFSTVTIDLYGKDIARLAEWLRAKDVTPVPARSTTDRLDPGEVPGTD